MSSGPSTVPTQNQRVRTRSMNSRRMTAKTLSMDRALRPCGGGRRLRAHQVDEDLIEGGLGELELGEAGAGRDQRLQDFLRVRLRGELELGGLRGAVGLGHQARIREDALGVPGGTVERDHEMAAAVRTLHVRERAV